MHYQVLDHPFGNRDVKKMQRLIEHLSNFINVKCFFLFSDKMGLFQTFWKSKVILTKQDWNERQIKLLKKILNKFSESLCQVSSNEKISNSILRTGNLYGFWDLVYFFGLVLEKSIFLCIEFVNPIPNRSGHVTFI